MPQQTSPYVEVLNPKGAAPMVLACEHASNAVPEQFTHPLADKEMLNRHIAWDPGARMLACELSVRFDAPLVCSKVSRLVYDCNRPPESDSSIPVKSERYDIPGNYSLTDAERRARVEKIYRPFHALLSGLVIEKKMKGIDPVLVTIHSFTPCYFDQIRNTEIGILHDSDSRMADQMLNIAPQVCGRLVERNKPYGPQDGVTHTLKKHGDHHRLPNVMLEIKNDLLSTALEIKTMADIIQKMLIHSLSKLAIYV